MRIKDYGRKPAFGKEFAQYPDLLTNGFDISKGSRRICFGINEMDLSTKFEFTNPEKNFRNFEPIRVNSAKNMIGNRF